MSAPSAPQMGGGGYYPPSAPGYPPQQQHSAYPPQGGNGGGFTNPLGPGAAPYPPATSGAFPMMPTQSHMPLLGNAGPGGQPPAEPNAPQQPGFISLPGFADAGFTPIVQPPTNPYFDNPTEPPKYERSIPPITAINEEDVHAAVREFADKKCCYGKPEPLKVENIEMKSAIKYNLVSFTEQRETVWKSEPYTNQAIEGPPGMGIVGPWDIRIYPDASFKDHKKEMRIPNTSYIRPCHRCGGGGNIRCTHCNGMGMEVCGFCHGSGKRFQDDMCTSCGGAGRRSCTWCNSQGFKKCTECNGRGQLYMYLQLIATWKNQIDEFITDSSTIPQKYISKAPGNRAASEQQKMVAPFTDFPDAAINNASRDLIGKHARAYTSQMIILEQKQSVDIIRIAEVNYKWKDKTGIFHVFGDNNYVYFPDYPSKCCGCCTIM